MKSDIRGSLLTLVSDPPDELIAYFARTDLPCDDDLRLNPLTVKESVENSKILQEHWVIGEALGLIWLDNANDSNPYCYVTKGPLMGSVIHLFHDDRACVAFKSITSFVEAFRRAIRDRKHIDELIDDRPFLVNTSSEIDGEIQRWLGDDQTLSDDVAMLYVSAMNTADTGLVEKLACDSDFSVRETIAERIVEFPQMELAAVCQMLARDSYPQVARCGEAALSAVKRVSISH